MVHSARHLHGRCAGLPSSNWRARNHLSNYNACGPPAPRGVGSYNGHARDRLSFSLQRMRTADSAATTGTLARSSFKLQRVRAANSKGSLGRQLARSQTSCGQQRLRTALSKGSPRLHLACDRAAGPGCLEGPPVEATLQHARTVLAVLGARRASYATGGARGPHSAFY